MMSCYWKIVNGLKLLSVIPVAFVLLWIHVGKSAIQNHK